MAEAGVRSNRLDSACGDSTKGVSSVVRYPARLALAMLQLQQVPRLVRQSGQTRFQDVHLFLLFLRLFQGRRFAFFNRQLRGDMWRLGSLKTFACPANLRELFFYVPTPPPEVEAAFRAYVQARWPLIRIGLAAFFFVVSLCLSMK